MKGLTILERIIIDSINNSKCTIDEMHDDTAISKHIINNILQALILKGIIQIKKNEYHLTNHLTDNVTKFFNTFSAKKITTGLQSDDLVQVISGLTKSEFVVTSGAYLLNSELILRKGNIADANK